MKKEFASYLENIEKNIKKLLPQVSDCGWQNESFGNLPSDVSSVHFEPLLNPTRSLVELGGKRWRPLLLVLCSGGAGNGNEKTIETAYSLAPLVEFVHTASLIHDDIEDSSVERRGKPAAYITYGTDVSINAGSWLYFQAGVAINSCPCSDELKLRLYKTYSEELRRLHLGQAMDISWHKNKGFFPTVGEYIAMVKNKTGTLASLAAKIGTVVAGASEETVARAGEIASEIGAGFQIIDDVINITKGNVGKKRGDDIVEGKKSLPVLEFVQCASKEEVARLEECFVRAAKEGIDSPAVEEAIEMLEKSGAIERARKQGQDYINSSCDAFIKLFGNDYSQNIKELFLGMMNG